MILFIRTLTKQRLAWALLFLTAIFLELCALFFQHVMDLQPCVMCIYERMAVLGIAAAGLIGMIQPNWLLCRWLGMAVWIYSAVNGLQLALQHTNLQLHPSPFNTCPLFPTFWGNMPLDHWLPWMFKASGDCSEIQWSFLSWSMPQWLIVAFAIYTITSIIIIAGNLIKGRCCE
jgi:disulfide bond formation protein DsbB